MKKITKDHIEHFNECEKNMSLDELLMEASSYGLIEYIKKYLDMGADVNGKIDFEILKIKPTYDIYSFSPLCQSILLESHDCTKYLIQRGANVNFPQGLIVQAMYAEFDFFYTYILDSSSLDILNDSNMLGSLTLLNNGANINQIDIFGESIFELIIKNTIIDSIGAINFVIRHKGDFNLKNGDNKMPLDLAIEYKDNRAMDLLISLGAKTSEELKNEDS